MKQPIMVKYICEQCGYARKYTKKEHALRILIEGIQSLLLALGMIAIIYTFFVTPTGIMNGIMDATMNKVGYEDRGELRTLTIEITKKCSGWTARCYASELYKNVSQIRYVPVGYGDMIYPPLEVYYQGGDCKNTANMYVQMLRSVGIKAEVKCSIEYKHCIAIVPNRAGDEELGGYFLIDLTRPVWKQKKDGDPIWEDYES